MNNICCADLWCHISQYTEYACPAIFIWYQRICMRKLQLFFYSKSIRFMWKIPCRYRNEPGTQSARTCNTEFGIVTKPSQPPNQRGVQSNAVNIPKNLNLLSMQCWLSETNTLFSTGSIRFHMQCCQCENKCKNYPKQLHFRWKRPCTLIEFVFCRMILKNRLYL